MPVRQIKKINGKRQMSEKNKNSFKKPATNLETDMLMETEIVQTEPVKRGRKQRNNKEATLTRNKIAAMLNQGISWDKIRMSLGVSKSTISSVAQDLEEGNLVEADADELVKKYPHALSKNVITDYENRLARDIKNGMDIIYKHMMDPDKLGNASLKDLGIVYNIFNQNLRLSTNRSTENVEIKEDKFDKLLKNIKEDDILGTKEEIIDVVAKEVPNPPNSPEEDV